MPMGWSALGRGVVNSLRLKYAKSFTMVRSVPKLKAAQQAENVANLKVGAFATLATPFVFSTVWQGSEDRTLDPKRTSIETTLGATAGAVISVGFAGMSAAAEDEMGSLMLGLRSLYSVKFDNMFNSFEDLIKEYHERGHQIELLEENTMFDKLSINY